MKKPDPKVRDLAEMRQRAEANEAAADEPRATVPPLDPYAPHEIRLGAVRILDPKTKAFVTVPGVSCSCERLGEPVPNEHAGSLVARLHALEVGLVRVARAVGVNLDAPPSEIEKLAGGHGPTVDAFREREAETRERAAAMRADHDEATQPEAAIAGAGEAAE